MSRENFSPGDTSSFGPLRRVWTDDGFELRYVSIPLYLKDRSNIYPKICPDREADPFDFEPKPTIGFESKTKDRGHEPDPNMAPRVEDKKMCVLFTDLCSRQIPVWKHLKKLLVSTSKLCDVTISKSVEKCL